MLQALIITLREGIEAFLIVAITLAYLRQTGRGSLASAVYWGIGTATLASFAAGWAFGQAEHKPLWEGSLALVAAVLVVSMVFYMLKAARHLHAEIARKIDVHAEREGIAAWLGIFGFVVLMITREGMEAALLVTSLTLQIGAGDMLAGALIGIALAALLAWGWGRFGSRINLGRFFQVTSVFLLLFSVQLVFYAFHEFTEASLLPLDNEYWHLATEPYSPEGQYGQWLTYALVAVPLGWLAVVALRDRLGGRRS